VIENKNLLRPARFGGLFRFWISIAPWFSSGIDPGRYSRSRLDAGGAKIMHVWDPGGVLLIFIQ